MNYTELFKGTVGIIQRNIKGRKLVFLGDELNLRKLLHEADIEVSYVATSLPENLNKGQQYKMLEDFTDKADEYYICIPFLNYEEALKKRIQNLGYMEYMDFCFSKHSRIRLQPKQSYKDAYGNVVKNQSNIQVVLTENCANCNVDIGNVNAHPNTTIVISGNEAYVSIKDGVSFGINCQMEVFTNGKLFIDEKTAFMYNDKIRVPAGCMVQIGKDCLFSNDIEIYAGDGHSIFDTATNERLNPCGTNLTKNQVLIGNHVWGGAQKRCSGL